MQTRALSNPIGFLLLPQFTMIALASAIEPLRIANRYIAEPYCLRLLSLDGKPVADANGIQIQVEASLEDSGHLGCLFIVSDQRPERFYSSQLRRLLHRLDRAGCMLGRLRYGLLHIGPCGPVEAATRDTALGGYRRFSRALPAGEFALYPV
jgi:AraC family transcriptional regulator, carnitine catabolism transcriptional activator